MDAASEWPVRQIRRHAMKMALIISVVKLKDMVEAILAQDKCKTLLRCSNI